MKKYYKKIKEFLPKGKARPLTLNCFGMSLVELLVTMAIIVLLLAVGVPAYRQYGNSNDLEQAAQDVKNALLETKNMALAPASDKPQFVKIGGEDRPANSYLALVTRNSNKIDIYVTSTEPTPTGTICNIPDSTDAIVKTVTLPASVEFSWSSAGGQGNFRDKTLQYLITEQGKLADCSANSTTLDIKSTKIGKSKIIKINAETGQVSIE